MKYQSRFGGLSSVDTWDYYASNTANSSGSMFWTSNDLSGKRIEFYILYAMEGTWCIGLKHPLNNHYKHRTAMSVSLDGCPGHCNHNGAFHSFFDESGFTIYSYCACDCDHGGFDCSIELVAQKGHMWQSIFLVASNAAAILPSIWALQQKFLDFWLSFMAVVSTFICMATIDEASKRAIHTSVSILTALLAMMGATRSANIVIVISIGILGLVFGWFLEFWTACRSIYCPPRFDLNSLERWQHIKSWFWNFMWTLQKIFRWRFVLLGFIALALAATCWKIETNESYWIWHRSNEQQEPEYHQSTVGLIIKNRASKVNRNKKWMGTYFYLATSCYANEVRPGVKEAS